MTFVAVLGLTGCSNDTGLSDETKNTYIEIEAKRLCDVQRQAFASQQELEKSFEGAMTTAGFTEEQKKALVELRDEDADFRRQISDRYTTVCK